VWLLRRRSRSDHGQGLVEFAIVLPVFLLIVFGAIDLGRVIWATDDITNAAREGARYASVHGGSFLTSCPTGPGLTQTLQPSCPAWSPDTKEPTRVATRGYFVAAGGSTTVQVCYYTTTSCSGDSDQSGATNSRGTYVTVTVQATVPILTGTLLGLHGFTVNAHSTVLVNN
jgi:Flp pilus assembly protein TadG